MMSVSLGSHNFPPGTHCIHPCRWEFFSVWLQHRSREYTRNIHQAMDGTFSPSSIWGQALTTCHQNNLRALSLGICCWRDDWVGSLYSEQSSNSCLVDFYSDILPTSSGAKGRCNSTAYWVFSLVPLCTLQLFISSTAILSSLSAVYSLVSQSNFNRGIFMPI